MKGVLALMRADSAPLTPRDASLTPRDAQIALLVYVPCLFASLLAVSGGVAMLRRKVYWLAVAGSVAVMLGGCMCAFAGPIVGIWSLVVLMKPDVKETFT